MTIAEQLIRAKADLDAVYQAGKAAGGDGVDLFKYATKIEGLFIRAVFPAGHEVTISVPNCLSSLTELIRQTTGLQKITVDIPTTQAYKPTYFAYRNTDINKVVFPDGIKFTDLTYFVSSAAALVSIIGAMDLSESTANATGFTACPALTEVRFTAGSIKSSISFNQSANLSPASRQSIVAGLAAVTEQQTLTLHSTVVDALTDAELTEIFNKNWITA